MPGEAIAATFNMGIRTGVFAALAAAVVISVVACTSGAAPEKSSESSYSAEASSSDSRLEQVKANLPGDFVLRAYIGQDEIGGQNVDLSAIVISQGKPVVLNFWGGLCPPCRAEMPALQRVHETLGSEVLFVGVDVGPFVGLGSRDDGKRLLAELSVDYPNGWIISRRTLNDYNIRGIPSTIFLTPDGKLFKRWDGAITEERLETLARELISESAS
ncbi:MAG: TlpA family protein disulfide reductase [Chloroflexi bacterium]|nr:TlpA family protein disulfide reductase [Chloroflexota bacterium]